MESLFLESLSKYLTPIGPRKLKTIYRLLCLQSISCKNRYSFENDIIPFKTCILLPCRLFDFIGTHPCANSQNIWPALPLVLK